MCALIATPEVTALSMRFSWLMVPEIYQTFWAAMARGEFITDAALEAGSYRKQGRGGWSLPVASGRAAAEPGISRRRDAGKASLKPW